jgi:hypothetical protein
VNVSRNGKDCLVKNNSLVMPWDFWEEVHRNGTMLRFSFVGFATTSLGAEPEVLRRFNPHPLDLRLKYCREIVLS